MRDHQSDIPLAAGLTELPTQQACGEKTITRTRLTSTPSRSVSLSKHQQFRARALSASTATPTNGYGDRYSQQVFVATREIAHNQKVNERIRSHPSGL